ncbi:MAG: S1 RNA-binding domain-containing protein [Clostridiales bacterium]|nr:MAG: S1 RNA-binding domain-containing protein [Clostridiales bacterium]
MGKKQKQSWKSAKTSTAKIVRIVPFGAFAEIYPGVDGLIHISQVAAKRIGKVEDELSVGQHVTARIVELDFEKQEKSVSA